MADAEDEDRFAYQSLLQELLFALSGFTGDVFVDKADSTDPLRTELLAPDACSVALAPDIVWARTHDRQQLDELVRLGFHKKQLHLFIDQERAAVGAERSLYRLALCEGLEEVLLVYEEQVALLQEELISGSQGGAAAAAAAAGLPWLTYQLADMQTLLPQLHMFAHDLRRRPQADALVPVAPHGDVLTAPQAARGAALLRLLALRRHNGQPLLQACLQRIEWHVNQVLCNQLTMWMVHGVLSDEAGEFFIRPRVSLEPSTPLPAADSEGGAAADTVPLADAPRRSRLDANAAGTKQQQQQQQQSVMDETYRDWHEAFEVVLQELPPVVTPHLATSVEFIGRAVRLLRAPPASALLLVPKAPLTAGAAGTTAAELLPHDDVLAFTEALRALQAAPVLSQPALERTVEAIRADVAARLWRLLVVASGLPAHLAALKDYMLLSRGDFWQCFLADARKLLSQPPRQRGADNDIAAAWASAAAKSTAQDDPLFGMYKLVLQQQQQQQQQQQPPRGDAVGTGGAAAHGAGVRPLAAPSFDAAWDGLSLEVTLPWPLGVLFTPRQLARYNALFQLLLRLKRVQLALEEAWHELGRICGRGARVRTSSARLSQLLALRQHMGHLVTHLQVYLQQDVVESSYSQLMERIAAAQDFAEAEHAHEHFLRALVTQSFLGQASLVRQLGEVFCLAGQIAGIVRAAAAAGGVVDWDAVQAVGASFERTLSSLYVNLQSKTLQQYDKAPHLRQLYLRLDFNGFIRRHNTQMVRTVSSSRAAAKQAAAAAAGEHERAVEERRLMQLRSATGP